MNSSLFVEDVTDVEDLPSNIIIISSFLVFLALLFILSSLANVFILLVFFRRSALRTTSNRFVMNLLIVNMFSTCFLIPFIILDITNSSFSIPQCLLTEFLTSWISSLSVFSTLAIAFDQYLAILYPLRYQNLITPSRGYSLLALTWSLSFCLSLTSFFKNPVLWSSCNKEKNSDSNTLSLTLSALNFLFIFLCPTLGVIYIYAHIYSEARQSSKRNRRTSLNPPENIIVNSSHQISSHIRENGQLTRIPSQNLLLHSIKHKLSNASQFMYREEGRTAKISLIVIILMIVCWLPYYLMGILSFLSLKLFTLWSKTLILMASSLYSLISPCVFAYRSKRLQRELKRVFCVKTADRALHSFDYKPSKVSSIKVPLSSSEQLSLNISKKASFVNFEVCTTEEKTSLVEETTVVIPRNSISSNCSNATVLSNLEELT